MSTYWFDNYYPEDATNTDSYIMNSYWPSYGPISSQSYYGNELSSYLNVFYSANIALETYFTDWLFHSESNRMIYSSTDYAFRRRAELKAQDGTSNNYNNLDLPFMNYKGKMIQSTDRPWANHHQYVFGSYIPELGKKIKFTPATFQYDATIFCHRDDELQYLTSQIIWDDERETQLEKNVNYSISIDDQDIILPGILGYSLDSDALYNENDWLQQSKIHALKLDFNLQTVLLRLDTPDDGNFCITNEVFLNFQTLHPSTEEVASTEVYSYINTYFDS